VEKRRCKMKIRQDKTRKGRVDKKGKEERMGWIISHAEKFC
jgi:hypothetical protein